MEEKIGVWIDKPLYRKMLEIPNIKGGNFQQYAHTDIDISKLNIDNVIKIKNMLVDSTTGFTVDGNGWYSNFELSFGTLVLGRKTLRIRNNQEWTEGYTAYVTLYYTKTTDTV